MKTHRDVILALESGKVCPGAMLRVGMVAVAVYVGRSPGNVLWVSWNKSPGTVAGEKRMREDARAMAVRLNSRLAPGKRSAA